MTSGQTQYNSCFQSFVRYWSTNIETKITRKRTLTLKVWQSSHHIDEKGGGDHSVLPMSPDPILVTGKESTLFRDYFRKRDLSSRNEYLFRDFYKVFVIRTEGDCPDISLVSTKVELDLLDYYKDLYFGYLPTPGRLWHRSLKRVTVRPSVSWRSVIKLMA